MRVRLRRFGAEKNKVWNISFKSQNVLFNPMFSILQVILDQKLGLFTSDKFLSGASGPALKSLCLVAEKVILHYPDEPSEKWLKAISMALTNSESATRTFASFATKRLGNTLGGLETLRQLGKQLSLFIWQNLGKC